MEMNLLMAMSLLAIVATHPVFAQDSQPWDREYRKCAEWLAAGGKVPAVKKIADVRATRSVRLIVDAGAGREGEEMVLGAGIPLKEGMVKDLSELGIRDANGALPAAFEKRTVYPDGSLQWVWADFHGKLGKEYQVTVREKAAPLPQPGVQASMVGEEIVVNNGALELKWNKNLATPTSVSVLTSGKKTPVAQGDGKGIYFINARGERYVLGGKLSELDFKIESCNRVRAVLRLEGWYVSEKGDKCGRALIRYDIAWNQPWMRMSHRFVVTDENDRTTYREIGVQFPSSANAKPSVRFGMMGKPSVEAQMTPGAGEAWLMQEKYPLYHKKERKCTAGVDGKEVGGGSEAEGWADLNWGGGGMVLAVKDFAPQFPKELAADSRGLCAKLWAGRTGMILDYKPETMAKDWWGEWLDRIEYSREWGNNRKTIDGKKPTDKSGKPAITPDMVKKVNPSCVGVARTHSLLVGWYAGAYDEGRPKAWRGSLNKPAIVQPDPKWLAHVDRRVMMPTLAKGEMGPEYEVIEKGISAFLDCLLYPRDAFPYTGWYEWGKHPELAYERLPDGRIFAQWYRLANVNYYYYNWNLAHTWMRTGDRKFLDEFERVNRFLADNHMIHWDGGRDNKKRGWLPSEEHFYAPLYWATKKNSFAENSTECITGFVYEYFLRDNRDYLDILSNMTQAFLTGFQYEYYETADMTLTMMCGLYRFNQDPSLLEKIKGYFKAMTDPSSATGLKDSFWKTEWNQLYKSHRKNFCFAQYYDLTGDPSAPVAIVKLQRKSINRYGAEASQPFEYQNRTGANFSRVYEWTKDDDCLYWVRHEILAAREIFERFFALPEAERGPDGFFKSKPWGTSLNQYLFDGVGFESHGKFAGKGFLGINGSTMPAIISFPMALWAMKGFPEE